MGVLGQGKSAGIACAQYFTMADRHGQPTFGIESKERRTL